jgi:hypothetical protein
MNPNLPVGGFSQRFDGKGATFLPAGSRCANIASARLHPLQFSMSDSFSLTSNTTREVGKVTAIASAKIDPTFYLDTFLKL